MNSRFVFLILKSNRYAAEIKKAKAQAMNKLKQMTNAAGRVSGMMALVMVGLTR